MFLAHTFSSSPSTEMSGLLTKVHSNGQRDWGSEVRNILICMFVSDLILYYMWYIYIRQFNPKTLKLKLIIWVSGV